jgi:hypothetical protein
MPGINFYSDRATGPVPRTDEEVTPVVWVGVVNLITRRVQDGSLAREFPRHSCPDFPEAITGTDSEQFGIALATLVPLLKWDSTSSPGSFFNITSIPTTSVTMDVVEFVGRYVAEPSERHSLRHLHEHLIFGQWSKHEGQSRFREDVELTFARNGLAFTVDDAMHVQRLGPPEARPLLSDFIPRTGDTDLDTKLRDAVIRFTSRNPQDRVDALEKLWDAFERLKTLELGGQKSQSIRQLIDRAAPGSPFRDRLEAESSELTTIGNEFHIRHFEHNRSSLPTPTATGVDYLFTRMLALIAYLLRQTGRM